MEELTAEQRSVVERPVDGQTFVVAAPGTGKTHTLAARVEALYDTGELATPDDVAVLSFTQAAVGVLKSRLQTHPVAASVLPTTIDALARRVLRDYGVPVPGAFEAVITAATELLDEDDTIGHFRHVVVDEAQDLASPRREFVEAILNRAGGFTVLGDPAQGIYGFSSQTAPTVDAIAELRRQFPAAVTLGLTKDHRLRHSAADLVSWAREDLMSDQPEATATRLAQALRGAARVSDRALALVLGSADEHTAVLCRTNGEVLQISRGLIERGVAHRIQAAADVAPPSRWIADLLGAAATERITIGQLEELEGPLSSEARLACWEALSHIVDVDDGVLSLGSVRARIDSLGSGEIHVPGHDVPVISTVHRSKGLEFDRVFVLDPELREPSDAHDEEVRVLFVALTRARDETLMIERPKPDGSIRRRDRRWIETPWRRETPIRVEVRMGDVDRRAPLSDGGDASDVQRHVESRVSPGDPVTLERSERYGQLDYMVLHRGLEIGRTHPDFVGTLDRLGVRPSAITGLAVDCVSTAVGAASVTEGAGLGPSGLWLVPEIFGFGQLR